MTADTHGDQEEVGQTLECYDCKASFIFTEGEAHFFQSKGLLVPKRCKPCRDLRREKHNAERFLVKNDHQQVLP